MGAHSSQGDGRDFDACNSGGAPLVSMVQSAYLLRNPQASRSEKVAGRTTSLSRPFHANQFFLAQSNRTLVCRDHAQANPPRNVSQTKRVPQTRSCVHRFPNSATSISSVYWVEAAKLAPRQNHELALVYEKEKQKGNANRATLAVARKMVAYLLAVDRREQAFVPSEDHSTTAA
jgi:hypothetical protein